MHCREDGVPRSGRGAWLTVLLAVQLCSGAAGVQAGERKLEAAFDANGLSSLRWAGVEMLTDGKPCLEGVVFEETSINAKAEKEWKFDKFEKEGPQVVFDAQKKLLRYTCTWGAVEFSYAPQADRLGLAIAIRNDSRKTLADFSLGLLRIKFPAAPAGLKGAPAMRSSLDNIAFVEAPFGIDVKPGAQGPTFGVTDISEKLVACCETIFPPAHFGLDRSADWGREYSVALKGGVNAPEPGASEIHPHGLPRIAAGKSQTFEVSLRFAPSSVATETLLSDLYGKFRAFWGPAHVWKDHRAIGALHLPSGGGGSSSNPRNWFQLKDLDVKSEAGKADFRKRMLEYADRAVKALKEIDAQGGIVWNLEGEENPHPISYIGDPRMVKTLAPEMDEAADEFFRKFLDAGLRTGVTLRPSQVYLNEEKKKWDHGTGSDGGPGRGNDYQKLRPEGLPWWRFFPVVERLCDKIAYAKKRWGCTLFYVDTNGTWQPTGEDGKFQWLLLTADTWKRIKERHPDVLLIPELVHGDGHYHAAQWAFCATYMELDYGGVWVTPRYARDLFPGAFSVINMKDAKSYDARRADLVAGVKRGDILLFRGWFSCSVNPKVKSIYEEARR